MTPLPRIFVQIASFRDTECQWTVKDMFEKAAHPERVFVGICWQYDPELDKECFEIPYPRPDQVREKHYHYKDAIGMSWARMDAQSLCGDEEYSLGIDAHMRFAPGWDDILIDQLSRCPTEKAVISTLLPGYVPPDDLQNMDGLISYAHIGKMGSRGEGQLMHIHGGLRPLAENADPFPSPFWVGNFSFARSEVFKALPLDPHLYFYGDELTYSARLFTHGYLVFQPARVALYHQWAGRDKDNKRSYRDPNDPRIIRNMRRMLHLLQLEPCDDAQAIAEIDRYALGTERSLADFWKYADIDLVNGTKGETASSGDWPAWQPGMAQTSAGDSGAFALHKKPMKPDTSTQRIFVQIASYRDPECQWTVKDMFEKAAHPERIFAGICWQYDPDADAHCFKVEAPFPDQVRIDPWHWKESKGVCWARNRTQQLWEGEEYTLVIDSHMRFSQGWDETLIADLAECDSQKPLISCHPAAYTPPDDLEQNPRCTIQRAHPYNNGDLRFKGEFLDNKPERPLNGAFIAAGFMFSKADIIREVPYDPYLYFNQEEITLSARFYTHGWDVFSSKSIVLYHYYNDANRDEKRPMHWQDNSGWSDLHARSMKRFDHLMGYADTDDNDALKDLGKYGMGTARSLKQYEEYSGIDFKHKIAGERALRCLFIKDLRKYLPNGVYIPELDETQPAAATQSAAEAVKPVAQLAPALQVSYAQVQSLQSVAGEGFYNSDTKLFSIPNPALRASQSFDIQIMPDGTKRKLNVDRNVPDGIMLIHNYLEKPLCDVLTRYADSQVFTKLNVVDHHASSKGKVKTMASEGRVTDHVDIDGMAGEVLSIMNDVYCNRLSPFYKVNFEWYERPQILRYSEGGKYNQHADADHWLPDTKTWVRTQDRDYSVLLYLNEEYEGGELHFPNQNFKFKPKAGMLAAFPSGHKYLHAALPTLSGLRYVIVSWAAILGTPRVHGTAPYASVFVRQKRF